MNFCPDPVMSREPRSVVGSDYSLVWPLSFSEAQLRAVSISMLEKLGLEMSERLERILVGDLSDTDARPYAMVYGGHQFGHWAGQLGDGRAISLGEVRRGDIYYTLQLKGAGPTPYSRSGDGMAVLRSSIREFLCSEAMHHLKVSTTRALSLATTGHQVLRDPFYDGHEIYEPGAMVCRVSESFLRFGHFEWYTATRQYEALRRLADYVLNQYYGHLSATDSYRYVQLYRAIAEKSVDTAVDWIRVGFTHGVLNTDNMQVLGHTIDYGPFGFVERFDPLYTPNTTDLPHRRYAFMRQLDVVVWNLKRLADALSPLHSSTNDWHEAIEHIEQSMVAKYLRMMSRKLGFDDYHPRLKSLIDRVLGLMNECELDWTMFYRELAQIELKDSRQNLDFLRAISYRPQTIEEYESYWQDWLMDYHDLMNISSIENANRIKTMNDENPFFIIRNYMYQMAIKSATEGDYSLVNELMELSTTPYIDTPNHRKWYATTPEWALAQRGCTQLSCSS